jgi:class 3 adenylate cyclase/tetratricopeptide (TPR) repeat protein
VAIFGITPVDRSPAWHAAKAALEIRDVLYELNRDAKLPSALDIHVGINSGPVIAGLMGGETKRTFTAIGETVDLAAILEDVSPRGALYVGPQTYEETRRDFDYEALPPVAIGEGRPPAPVYKLLAIKPSRRVKRDSERRQATVMFAAVTGFKALNDRFTPEQITRLLNDWFGVLEVAVRTYGGVVDKFLGEGVMALFGVPNAIEHAPRQAVNAAIDIRNQLVDYNRTRQLPVALGVHIGINTGLVIAGEIGGRVRRDFTAIGDTVNLAARLKEGAPDAAVYVGPETHRYTRDDFAWRALPPMSVKGKEKTIQAYELMSVTERVHRGAANAGPAERQVSSAMVGRERELAQIESQVRHLVDGRGGIVTLVGEAGMGKSRLVGELRAAPALHDARVLEARSLAIGQNLSFHPFVDLLRNWAGIPPEEAEDVALARLETALQALTPEEAGETLPFLATMMGMHLTGALAERVEGIQGEALERLVIRAVRALLEALAEQSPLVLIFEDLHWADQSSIKLLEIMLRMVQRHRVLFLIVGRPDSPETMDRIVADARAQHALQHADVQLGRLTDQQCATLIRNLLRIDALPYATEALIIRKAEGNPFYIEEVIRSLIDAGAVEATAGGFRLTEKIDTVEIPGTIQEVIMARVDRLDEPTRYVLQVASVIGRFVYFRILAGLMEEVPDLEARLTYLEERQLLLQRRTRETASVRRTTLRPEREYLFKHALLQETVYESILQRTRKDLHRQVAESIETAFAERLVDFFGMLAYHFSRADDAEKAEEYLFKAGEEAARSAASSEALAFFREASRLYLQIHGDGGDPAKRALLEKNIGLALMNTGNLTESMEHFDEALRHLGDPIPPRTPGAVLQFGGDLVAVFARLFLPRLFRASHGKTRYRDDIQVRYPRIKAQSTSNPTRLVFDYFRAIRWLNQTDPTAVPEQVIGLYSGFAALFAYSGLSFRIGRRYLAISEKLLRPGHAKDLFDHGCLICIHNYLEGKWNDEAGVVADDVIEQALRHGGLWEVNTYLGLDCDRRIRRGDFAAAQQRLKHLEEIADLYGFEFAQTNHNSEMMLLLLEQRRLAEALVAAEHYYAGVHDDTLRVLALGSKAKAQTLIGDLEAAAATLKAAGDVVKRSPIVPPWHLSAYAVGRFVHDLARLDASGAEASQGHQARASARAALAVTGKVAVQRTEVYRLTARMHSLLGDARRTQTWWRKAISEGEQLGARPELARTYLDVGTRMAQHKLTQFEGATAEEYVERARALFDTLGLVWEMAETEARARRAA